MTRQGIVLEGGGMRGMFTCGITDVLMEHDIWFDALVGVSAGILFGCNYKSGQIGRGLRYNLRFKDDKRYMSWQSLWKTGDYVNTEFAYHTLPETLDPFDKDAFRNNPMEFYVTCTDIIAGKPVYQRIDEIAGDAMEWFRATASMPIFARPVQIGSLTLLDGGLSDSIPLQFLQNKGCEKNLVVLTQPMGYRKKKSKATPLIKLFTRKYPQVTELMKTRHEAYNKQLDYIEQQVAQGNTFVLAPRQGLGIGRIEQNEKKMRMVYEHGRQTALQNIGPLKEFLNQKYTDSPNTL